MKEFVISTNAFELPKILEGNEAEYTLIIRLLLLEPGTNQNHPDMGIEKSKIKWITLHHHY